MLVEAARAQQQWLDDRQRAREPRFLDVVQRNRIERALVRAWSRVVRGKVGGDSGPKLSFAPRAWYGRPSHLAVNADESGRVVVAAQRASVEEACTADFLAETARAAGLANVASEDVELLHPTEPSPARAAAHVGGVVDVLWKLYPYEWLAHEELGRAVSGGGDAPGETLWLEPPWKLVCANKAILPLLWELFPGHPNLLPAFWDADAAAAHEAAARGKLREGKGSWADSRPV